MTSSPFRSWRQQWSDTLPQIVRNEINTHAHTLPTKITNRKVATQVILKRSVRQRLSSEK